MRRFIAGAVEQLADRSHSFEISETDSYGWLPVGIGSGLSEYLKFCSIVEARNRLTWRCSTASAMSRNAGICRVRREPTEADIQDLRDQCRATTQNRDLALTDPSSAPRQSFALIERTVLQVVRLCDTLNLLM